MLKNKQIDLKENTLCCNGCALFSRRQNICIEKHMGDKPEYYGKPKWMGCSYRIDRNKTIEQLDLKEV